MVDQGKRVPDLTNKGSLADSNDVLVFVYSTSNTSQSQTALISAKNLFGNTANLQIVAANLVMSDIRSDPANSSVLSVPAGTLFFSNSFGYFAVANNLLKRFAISSF